MSDVYTILCVEDDANLRQLISEELLSAGYRNRYRHPHPQVLSRLDAAGITVWRSDLDGALALRLGPWQGELQARRAQAKNGSRGRQGRRATWRIAPRRPFPASGGGHFPGWIGGVRVWR